MKTEITELPEFIPCDITIKFESLDDLLMMIRLFKSLADNKEAVDLMRAYGYGGINESLTQKEMKLIYFQLKRLGDRFNLGL